MAGRPRPLALGVVRAVPNAAAKDRNEIRVALALFANEEGYALIDIFEVAGDTLRDEPVLRGVAELAEQTDAEALIVFGAVDRARVEEIADRVRMVVREAAG